MEKLGVKEKFKSLAVPEKKIKAGFSLLTKYRSAVMGLAAIWIFVFHEWNNVFKMEIPFYIASRIKQFGYGGVDIFLFLSGIGLTYAIGKTKLPGFYYRRIKRLILPFLSIAFVRAYLENWPWDGLIDNITGRGFYTISIYCFLWFVPAIMTFYLFFPIYWKLFKKIGPFVFTASALIIWTIYSFKVKDTQRADLFGFTNRMPVFMIGILVGWLAQKKKDMPFKRKYYLPMVLLFALGLFFLEATNFNGYYLLVPTSNCCIPTLCVAVTLPFLLAKGLNELECHKGTCIIGKILNKILIFFGGISLEFYCLQEWFANTVVPKMREREWSDSKINFVLFFSTVAIAFAASIVFKYFWKLVELPFTRRKNKKTAPVKEPAFVMNETAIEVSETGADYLNSVAERMENAAERIEAAANKLTESKTDIS